MTAWSGVIEKATGDLLRFGYCDFANDGSFDPATEEIRHDVPQPAYRRRGKIEKDKMHRWDGSDWTLVDDPSATEVVRPGRSR